MIIKGKRPNPCARQLLHVYPRKTVGLKAITHPLPIVVICKHQVYWFRPAWPLPQINRKTDFLYTVPFDKGRIGRSSWPSRHASRAKKDSRSQEFIRTLPEDLAEPFQGITQQKESLRQIAHPKSLQNLGHPSSLLNTFCNARLQASIAATESMGCPLP